MGTSIVLYISKNPEAGLRHAHGSEMTQIWDPYSGNGSGDTALLNAAMYGAWIPPKHACQFC